MIKTILRSPVVTTALFIVAAALLLFGSIGAVQAAPRVTSNDWRAQVELANIDTALVENGSVVEGDTALFKNLVSAGDFKVGVAYGKAKGTEPYSLAVKNTGNVDEYVRVTITKYWTNGQGKEVDLDPAYIELGIAESGWIPDTAASTEERTVLYYPSIVKAGGTTKPCINSLKISNAVMKAITVEGGQGVYDYEGLQFHVKVTADAVQTHNGKDAMTGVWGRTNKG